MPVPLIGLFSATSINKIPQGQTKKCSPEVKQLLGQPNTSHTITLLSVRVKTADEKRLSLAAHDTSYPPFLPQQ